MLVKSLLAGTILSVMAGGIVYYGMGEGLTASVPNTASEAVTSSRTDVKSDTTKSNITATSRGRDSAMSGAIDDAPKPPASKSAVTKDEVSTTRSTLDRMMGRKAQKEQEAQDEPDPVPALEKARDIDPIEETPADMRAEPPADEEVEARDAKPKKRWLREYLNNSGEDKSETLDPDEEAEAVLEAAKTAVSAEVNAAEDEVEVDKVTTKTVTKIQTIEAKGVSEGETMTRKATGVFVVKEDGSERRVNMSDMTGDGAISEMHPSGHSKLSAETVKLLMTETAKLEIPDMRDQAYLNIVDYALSKGARETAQSALQELSREELRDTARGRVAVSLAKAGRVSAAFDVIETLEIEELQDPIRLQIIQALTDYSAEHSAGK
ncbi:hypothetical protein ACJ3XI_04170 [Litorimonas sp. RW-G-Af-16]|uniref:hypothetical protein n=1 Tax=Litorimonas sp. RW-G-Af-16 TaxID=3241168 RepID=UPI00390C78F6